MHQKLRLVNRSFRSRSRQCAVVAATATAAAPSKLSLFDDSRAVTDSTAPIVAWFASSDASVALDLAEFSNVPLSGCAPPSPASPRPRRSSIPLPSTTAPRLLVCALCCTWRVHPGGGGGGRGEGGGGRPRPLSRAGWPQYPWCQMLSVQENPWCRPGAAPKHRRRLSRQFRLPRPGRLRPRVGPTPRHFPRVPIHVLVRIQPPGAHRVPGPWVRLHPYWCLPQAHHAPNWAFGGGLLAHTGYLISNCDK